MKFDITNRYTGAVQLTADIDCREDASTSIKIGLAIRWAVKSRADLSGAYLSRAYLSRAYLSGAYLSRAYLSGAYLSGAYLSGAYLSGAYLSGADLSGAYLSGAHLSRADLSGADLSGADLSGADLSGANLSGANLSGADLSGQWIICGPMRADGYQFLLCKLTGDTEPMVRAGCRYLSITAARKHWTDTRGGTPLGIESLAAIDWLETAARARGLMSDAATEAATEAA